ncbi:MAG: 6-carboxyhexanoate--CoA ligase [Leptospirales bacterium]
MTDAYFSIRMRVHRDGRHISGGEDLVPAEEYAEAVVRLGARLFPLMEGDPLPQQILTIDPVPSSSIVEGRLLPVRALESSGPEESRIALSGILSSIFSPATAPRIIDIFDREILGRPSRNGALLVGESGEILSNTQVEGIRTTHMGCRQTLKKLLIETVDHYLEPPSHRFVDALILSSKVLMADPVLLEICASDDPTYQTGYLASRSTGYVRIPFIKPPGLPTGGRLYIVRDGADIRSLVTFLRKTPVLFTSQFPPPPLPSDAPPLRTIPSATTGEVRR